MKAVGNLKQCSTCKQVKHVDEYHRSRNTSDGRHNQCKPCARATTRKTFKKTYPQRREALLAANRQWMLEKKYGITVERYEAMLAAQGGVCAICKKSCSSGKRLAVDHDHACCAGPASCGKCVRGLLCSRCNNGLGCFEDSYERFEAALRYLGLVPADIQAL